MGFRIWLYKHTFPLHHWVVTKRMFGFYEDIKGLERKQTKAIEAYQLRKLRELIGYARENIPHYSRSLKKVDLKKSVKAILNQIPILEKELVKADYRHFTNMDRADHRITTSGSTGMPLLIYADREQLERRLAMNLRNQEWMGYEFGQKNARLWHQKIGMSTVQWLKELFEAFLARRKFIPVFEIGSTNLDRILDSLERYDPELIDGYAEAYQILVTHAKRQGKKRRFKRIVSSAQVQYPSTRKELKQWLAQEIFDRYGSREFSGIAQECTAHRGKHVNSYLYILEIVDDKGRPAKSGHILITDLHNRATPLIRYRIGDLGRGLAGGKCSCGLSWPRIQEIVGRDQSVIVTPKGRLVPGTFFDHVLKDFYDCMDRWQVVQERKGELEVRVQASDRKAFKKREPELVKALKPFLDGMKVTVKLNGKLAMGKTGKHNHTVSTVKM